MDILVSTESAIGSPFAYLMRVSTSLPNEDATTDKLSVPPTDGDANQIDPKLVEIFLVCWIIYAIVLIIHHVIQAGQQAWKLKTTYARISQGEEAC